MANANLTRQCLGRMVFDANPMGNIGDKGKVLWQGIFSSFRPAWKPFIVADLANKPAYEEMETIKFLQEKFKINVNQSFNKPNQYLLEIIANELSHLKIRYKRPDKQVREYRANANLGPNCLLPNTVDGGMSIAQYFKEHYKYQIKYPKLPTLHVGPKDKKMYLPMELTVIKKQACPQMKRISDVETADMIKFTAKPPQKRMFEISKKLNELKDECFQNDQFAQAFGIKVNPNFTPVEGRVLPHPPLAYSKNQTDPNFPRNGKWTMREQDQFNASVFIDAWCLITVGPRNKNPKESIGELIKTGQFAGVNFKSAIPLNEKDKM